jgi:hypothetical protein
MARAMLDGATELRSTAAVTTSGQGTPIAVKMPMLATSAWQTNVVTAAPGGTYTLTLEVATAQAGPYTTISTPVWPPGQASGNVQLGINASMSLLHSPLMAWVRLAWTLGGASPSLTFRRV